MPFTGGLEKKIDQVIDLLKNVDNGTNAILSKLDSLKRKEELEELKKIRIAVEAIKKQLVYPKNTQAKSENKTTKKEE